ncbi:MAG: hypothetical protein AB8G11_06465 [Saprospiraceae bacterium]
MYYKSIFFFCVFLVSNLISAQTDNIDLERITPKKLKKSLIEQELFKVDNIANLSPTCPHADDSIHYYHNYTVFFDAPIDSVWTAYYTINPAEVWKSKIISFGFIYTRESDELFYKGETFNHLEEGQMLFLTLSFLGGIFKVNLAQELMQINEDAKRIQFCYVKYGKSQGTQILTLTEENGKTKVSHDTYYKSHSTFRDKRIYPYFHKITIRDLHKNVGKVLGEN